MRSDHPTGTKSRVLFIRQYMFEHTDEEHPVFTHDLIDVCEQNGFNVNRVTLHDDIRNIEAMGTDIITQRGKDQDSFFIGQRTFDLAEVKMLIDAVASCRMISVGQSVTLTEKLSKLVAEPARHVLISKIYMDQRIKSDSHRLLINTDVLCKAIDAKKQVSFTYLDYDRNKRRIHRHDGELYYLSPYALIWSDDRYYIVGHTAKRNGITTFRVDRMDSIEMIDQDAVVDSNFNPVEYSSSTIKMFGGNMTDLKLLCENRCMSNIIDRFGEEVFTTVYDDEHFIAEVKIAISPTFYGWLVQYAGKISILAPKQEVENYHLFLEQCLSR